MAYLLVFLMKLFFPSCVSPAKDEMIISYKKYFDNFSKHVAPNPCGRLRACPVLDTGDISA